MTKEELKKLSNQIFFDNEEGGITPMDQRNFNDKLIEGVVTTDELSSKGLESDILPSNSGTYSIGNNEKVWNNIYTHSISAESEEATILIKSEFIPSENNRINLGNESNKFLNLHVHKINGINFSNTAWSKCEIEGKVSNSLYWNISGNSLLLSGEYIQSNSSSYSIHITNIPEIYLKRIQTGNYCLDIRNNNKIVRISGNISSNENNLNITSLDNETPFNTENILSFSSFTLPLQEDKNEVIRQATGTEYGDWNYSTLNETQSRTRIVKPWIQDIYSDGRAGEKIYLESYTDKEEAIEIKKIYEEWTYKVNSDKMTCRRERRIFNLYIFSDIEIQSTEFELEPETASITIRDNENSSKVFGYPFKDIFYIPEEAFNHINRTTYKSVNLDKISFDGNNYFITTRSNEILYSPDGIGWSMNMLHGSSTEIRSLEVIGKADESSDIIYYIIGFRDLKTPNKSYLQILSGNNIFNPSVHHTFECDNYIINDFSIYKTSSAYQIIGVGEHLTSGVIRYTRTIINFSSQILPVFTSSLVNAVGPSMNAGLNLTKCEFTNSSSNFYSGGTNGIAINHWISAFSSYFDLNTSGNVLSITYIPNLHIYYFVFDSGEIYKIAPAPNMGAAQTITIISDTDSGIRQIIHNNYLNKTYAIYNNGIVTEFNLNNELIQEPVLAKTDANLCDNAIVTDEGVLVFITSEKTISTVLLPIE